MKRSGFGVLIAIVVLLMACLLVAGMSQLYFSGQVYGQSAGGAGGMAAEYLAESAIEDVMVRLSADLNDPGKPLFKEVRNALLTRKPPRLDLTRRYKIEHLKDAIKTSPDAAFHGLFEVEDPQILLRVAPQTDTGEPQMLEVTATVRLKLGRRAVVRTVRLHRQVGITRVAPKRPFDAVPFAILQTMAIADTRKLAEEIQVCVKAYNRTGELLEGWKSTVEGKPLGVAMTATLPPLAVGPERATEALSEQLLADEQYFFRALWDELEEAPLVSTLPPDDSVIFAKPKEEVKLEEFQYYKRLKDLEPLVEELRKVRERFKPVMKPMEDAASAGALSSATHSGWAGNMGTLGRDLLKLLKEIQEKLFAIVKHMKAHSQPGINSSVVQMQRHWESQVPIYPLAHHISGGKALHALVKEWPAASGHLSVFPGPRDDDDRPPKEAAFTFKSAKWKGSAIVSLAAGEQIAVGPIQLDGDRDRLVVKSDGVHITGAPIQAALVARSELFTEEDARVEGSIILERYSRPEEKARIEPWRGRVKFDPRYRSGTIGPNNDLSKVVLEAYTVGVNPRVSFKEVVWE